VLQHTATHCNTLHHSATHWHTMQYTATHCNTLRHTATHCNTLQLTQYVRTRHVHPFDLPVPLMPCNTVQHSSATHCNPLQHTAARCNTFNIYAPAIWKKGRFAWGHCFLQHTTTHCNALQHTAVHCNTLHSTHYARTSNLGRFDLWAPLLCCTTLQYAFTHSKAFKHCNKLQLINTLQQATTHLKCTYLQFEQSWFASATHTHTHSHTHTHTRDHYAAPGAATYSNTLQHILKHYNLL